jgi:hypothetical protein
MGRVYLTVETTEEGKMLFTGLDVVRDLLIDFYEMLIL